MNPNEIEKILKGKTILKIAWHQYREWPMCINEIHFTDGTIIELSGNADYARIESLKINEEYIDVDE